MSAAGPSGMNESALVTRARSARVRRRRPAPQPRPRRRRRCAGSRRPRGRRPNSGRPPAPGPRRAAGRATRGRGPCSRTRSAASVAAARRLMYTPLPKVTMQEVPPVAVRPTRRAACPRRARRTARASGRRRRTGRGCGSSRSARGRRRPGRRRGPGRGRCAAGRGPSSGWLGTASTRPGMSRRTASELSLWKWPPKPFW